MSGLSNKKDFVLEISEHHLYPKLLLQIKKDFELTGIQINIDQQTSPQNLIEIISQSVYQLLHNHFDTFMQLLYRIDISEHLMSSDTVDSAENVTQKATFEIIKREWQKVQWREKFSQ